jgi:hypothetical protein
VAVVVGALLLWGGPPQHHLELRRADSGEVVLQVPVRPGDTVRMGYTHSSDATPVEQGYRVLDDGRLALAWEKYCWYGAGLEFSSTHTMEWEDGYVTVSGYDLVVDPLALRAAYSVKQWISVGDKHWIIQNLVPGGTRLELCVGP